jgi:hypothetical protein
MSSRYAAVAGPHHIKPCGRFGPMLLDGATGTAVDAMIEQARTWAADAVWVLNAVPLNVPTELVPSRALRARPPSMCHPVSRPWVRSRPRDGYGADTRAVYRGAVVAMLTTNSPASKWSVCGQLVKILAIASFERQF